MPNYDRRQHESEGSEFDDFAFSKPNRIWRRSKNSSPKQSKQDEDFAVSEEGDSNTEIMRARLKADRKERKRNFFVCASKSCKTEVEISNDSAGTKHRNHCPCCLTSKHVDDKTPGDRSSGCGATMKAVAIAVKDCGEVSLVHKCNGCDKINVNRVAGDDSDAAIFALLESTTLELRDELNPHIPEGIEVATSEKIEEIMRALQGGPSTSI